MPSDLIRGWEPVRVKKTRQVKNAELRSDSIGTEKAPGALPARRSQFLLRGPAAVDREIGAGDLGGIVAAQEQRKGCDLFRCHELLGRLRVEEHVLDDLLLGHVARLHGLWDLVLDQRRPDITGTNAVAGD